MDSEQQNEQNEPARPEQNYAHPQGAQSPGQPQSDSYNTLAVVGFILIFIIPLVGFILCILALKEIKRTGEKGHGFAKAGIIIFILETVLLLVFGLLFALSLNTFNDVQLRARDTERKTDINALHVSYEVYFNDNGYYPTYAVASDSLNFPALDYEALIDSSGNSLKNGAVPSAQASDYQYYYEAKPADCNNVSTNCTSYTLGSVLESDSTKYTKSSLN